MTSFKMTSLNLNKFKDQISNRHKFCLIVCKNNVIFIKIVEIMALFRVFLDKLGELLIIKSNGLETQNNSGKSEQKKNGHIVKKVGVRGCKIDTVG